MKIAIVGGTGYLGQKLAQSLVLKGHSIVIVTRRSTGETEPAPYRFLSWPLVTNADENELLSCEAVINLAGASIGDGRWTATRKQIIYDSRVNLTKELSQLLLKSTALKVFLSSSAVGFYGDRKTEILKEDSPRGEGFLADVCADWEKAVVPELSSGPCRVVNLRTGVVLSRNHGFLDQMEMLYKMKIGGPVGSGDQIVPWIHWQDWVSACEHILSSPSISGPVNLAAPTPVSLRTLDHQLRKCNYQSISLPSVPAPLIRMVLGEMAQLALDSTNARPAVLEESGFKFKFYDVESAMRDLYHSDLSYGMPLDFYEDTTFVPRSLTENFEFFSDAKNLEKITPAILNFKIVGMSTEKIESGTLIDYKLKIHGVPADWRTKINLWNPPHEFSDVQLKGPYKVWDHTHRFFAVPKQTPIVNHADAKEWTLMTDQVYFKLPFGFLGRTGGILFVKKDVQNIFSYRKTVIRELASKP
jgi:uncharacterized protein (TIGR01777 family)